MLGCGTILRTFSRSGLCFELDQRTNVESTGARNWIFIQTNIYLQYVSPTRAFMILSEINFEHVFEEISVLSTRTAFLDNAPRRTVSRECRATTMLQR
ncbi:hypothetical protein chiPu_0015368 [Chiloscyllium punctatum]|uniref:Uncharacterized protein n=1 Tax=Chiloscyllium punctatum TaxID=137246 RepID=A0A401T2L5_CHIPU|nr:hypothetical protein [Chiloscyllium punctatum]